eukprot:6190102-Pleurochrysis_carterae.AAC.1
MSMLKANKKRRRRQPGNVTIVRSASGGVSIRTYTGPRGTRLGLRLDINYTSSKLAARSFTKGYDAFEYHMPPAR